MTLKKYSVETRAKIYTLLSLLGVFILGLVSIGFPKVFFATFLFVVFATLIIVFLLVTYELIYEAYKDWLTSRDSVSQDQPG